MATEIDLWGRREGRSNLACSKQIAADIGDEENVEISLAMRHFLWVIGKIAPDKVMMNYDEHSSFRQFLVWQNDILLNNARNSLIFGLLL